MRANFEGFTIKDNWTQSKGSTWGAGQTQHHIVTVKHGGKLTRFDFWGSQVRPEIRTEYDLLNAFYCFVSDAVSGMDSFNDFCANFGCDDPGRALSTWKACKRAAEKLARIYGGDVWGLADRLQEVAA